MWKYEHEKKRYKKKIQNCENIELVKYIIMTGKNCKILKLENTLKGEKKLN